MRVAVVGASVPFVRGGAEMLEEELVRQLRARDVEVVHVRLPFDWSNPAAVQRSMAGAAALRLPNVDRVFPLKFPAWLVPHAEKVAWVFHQFRQVYDLWESGLSGWSTEDRAALELRRLIMQSDTTALAACRQVYTYSPTTRDRLRRFNGIDSSLLHTPLASSSVFRSGVYGDEIVALGRVSGSKRQALAVEALALTRTPVRLTIAGVADPPEYGQLIHRRVEELGLLDRVTFIDRFITEDEKISLLETALASVYAPIDEDNFGYVTAESFLARRAVVTATDAGGVCWIVEDGVTGFVTDPKPLALAGAFDTLFDERARAAQLGTAGFDRLAALNLDWDHTTRTLLA